VGDLLYCGIDEAGRGSVIGPLVISAIAVPEKDVRHLRRLGVADSKTLSPEKRFKVFQLLKELYRFEAAVLEPWRVDSSLRVFGGEGLNMLELREMARLIDVLKPDKVVIDSPDRNSRKAREVVAKLAKHPAEITCMIKGDRKNSVVAAASIVAKVIRDMLVAELRKTLGDFGSGYPSDPRTRKWLAERVASKNLPPEVRRGWKTVNLLGQMTLDEF